MAEVLVTIKCKDTEIITPLHNIAIQQDYAFGKWRYELHYSKEVFMITYEQYEELKKLLQTNYGEHFSITKENKY
jgi:phosphoribosyl-AMP cyclohydrolase